MPEQRFILAFTLFCVSSTAVGQASMDTLIADGHYLRARPLVQAALARNPNDPHALVQRSVLEWAFFHFDEAIATAEKAVAAADKSGETHTQLANALGAKLVNSNAGTFEKLGLARRFRKEAELSVQLDPNSLDALEDLARFYNEAPSMAGGDKAKARDLIERVAKLDPARGAALKVSAPGEDKTVAEAVWKAAIAARPESPAAHDGLAALYAEQGAGKAGFAEAQSEARRSLALKPSRIVPYRQLAALYAATGRWPELDALLKQAATAVPDDLSPAYQAGKTILTGNDAPQMTRAEALLRAYLSRPAEGDEPSHAAAHWRLGLVLEKLGRRPEAVQELQAAVREDRTLEGAKKDLKRLN